MNPQLRRGHRSADKSSPFYVPPFLDVMGRLVERHRKLFVWLGGMESAVLEHRLREIRVDSPVYICGLARSGSTLLHEILTAHPGVATHRIKDYPLVYTPYWWRRAARSMRVQPPRERPHRDKVMITIDSPDALEEMLWMAFFPSCHDPTADRRLGPDVRHRKFEALYVDHIRKLLLAEQATRYVAKANYHVARIPYLLRLFPDCKFVIPVRSPAGHIASLVRQHEWFSKGHFSHPRSRAYMQRSGHFEFGLDRRPMNLGNQKRVEEIIGAWEHGEEVRGWAMYWDMVHAHIADLLDSDPLVRKACLVVRFEDLCAEPAESLRTLLDHCALPRQQQIVEQFSPRIRRPDYYDNSFSTKELMTIHSETATVANRWGYGDN